MQLKLVSGNSTLCVFTHFRVTTLKNGYSVDVTDDYDNYDTYTVDSIDVETDETGSYIVVDID